MFNKQAKTMKTFEDLKFVKNESGTLVAIEYFDNGYGIYVLHDGTSHYGNDVYEVAVLKDGIFCFDTPITDLILVNQSIDQVNDVVKRVQEL